MCNSAFFIIGINMEIVKKLCIQVSVSLKCIHYPPDYFYKCPLNECRTTNYHYHMGHERHF